MNDWIFLQRIILTNSEYVSFSKFKNEFEKYEEGVDNCEKYHDNKDSCEEKEGCKFYEDDKNKVCLQETRFVKELEEGIEFFSDN